MPSKHAAKHRIKAAKRKEERESRRELLNEAKASAKKEAERVKQEARDAKLLKKATEKEAAAEEASASQARCPSHGFLNQNNLMHTIRSRALRPGELEKMPKPLRNTRGLLRKTLKMAAPNFSA